MAPSAPAPSAARPRAGAASSRAARQWACALALTALWYVGAHLATAQFIGVAPGREAWGRDLGVHLLLGGLLFGMARSLGRFALAMMVLFSAFTLGNALKLAVLGGPVMPDDLVAARNLFLLLEGWPFWGSVAMLVLPFAALLWMFAWRSVRAWALAAGAGLGATALALQPAPASSWLDARFGDWVWNQRGNYEMRGLPLHLLQEGLRHAARRDQAPDAATVGDALAALGAQAPDGLLESAASAMPRRNVHMIVLESFWDPMALTAAGLSADPLDPAFRALWQAGGGGRALSPVFGGYTANAEFEALCGFPVMEDAVFFEGRLRRDVPCLPRHLGEAGYLSVASHPNAAPFWNRINAYRRIGFGHYRSARNFELDDMNGEFLSDASLYRQVMAHIEPLLDGPQPLFNYVLTYFGHLDYPLNEQRPEVITAAAGEAVVQAYANTVHYKSRELMAFLDELRARDPEGLIVLFGDHLPSLGMNHGGYVESGLLARDRALFDDEMFRTLVATPLVVIDGLHGPVATGDLPLYALPALILDLLGDRRDTMLRFAARGDDRVRVRPLPGMHFSYGGDWLAVCRGDGEALPECAPAAAWGRAVAVLERDLFRGRQHALQLPDDMLRGLQTAEIEEELEDQAAQPALN